ncbi:MAG TPA: response regulator [Gammaproteobacteria bacterium]|jgi:DNA-binding NtrC family response regulator|uniref:Fis family transcriptional regulator n=5 Tax=OM182 clade TaxID=745002 RepID=A0A0R2T9I2_9GAMM|nr:MAG: Fis family transcriptional regulator [OM182 bacterium BACL3 MAG-120619-bin3]KRO85083.1 MAG: Fis family transcriptional regulator [OM182 bacterium BACL3 MAG-120920-bin41]KRP29149.1 MAG: Fis family transcriptional regulator [OM182 bacterium BACL3 MAG-120924-bin41]KRP38974.1 MAG: Fis family transcriptional regulator [OM182 bacterium BACL3 MAG-120531-bin86]MBT3522772.1 sigma-54-dependent Fis family transcriptional regulator [Gammaproteobacteria bacterium]MDP4661257.1 sigma-54 dependent tra|tara:strand:+ start:251 stop:1618 length:1368 start_codon:yes stop_codon:yes gene_type:complete
MTAANHILVVEDEAVIRSSLRRLLERHEYKVSEAGSVQEALDNFDINSFDVVLSDLRLPGAPGTDLIKATTRPVLIMTSYSSIRSAIDSMKLGAVDYIAKPFEHSELLESVAKVLRDHAGGIELATADEFEPPVHGMIGSCPQMMELFRRIRKVALTNSTVLINGESGTGKELVAKAIHKLSSRCDNEMISVNCAAIPENLIESELFGHEKGAFTGATATRTGLVEAAHGSTLFLDEIGELPLEAQARLLRVLQESEIRKVGSVQSKKVDVRLVVATHRDLKQLVVDGLFREDLYYRINVMTLLIPPLRDRGNDILELADAILIRTCKRLKTPVLSFADSASQAIAKYPWPGNVRELENAIERAVVLAEDAVIGEELLAIETEKPRLTEIVAEAPIAASAAIEELSLEDYFQRFVVEHEDMMNETQLAKKLGISRKCLWERRQRFGIPRKKKQEA